MKDITTKEAQELLERILEIKNDTNMSQKDKDKAIKGMRDTLILSTVGIARKTCSKYINHRYYNDMFQDCMLAAIDAIDKYDCTKNQENTFFYYIKVCMKNYDSRRGIRYNIVRPTYKYKDGKRWLDYPKGYIDIDDTMEEASYRYSPEKIFLDKEKSIKVNEEMNKLPSRTAEMIKKNFGLNNTKKYSIVEMQNTFGITQSAYHAAIKKAVTSIGKRLKSEGL